jgi:hypothetical protein
MLYLGTYAGQSDIFIPTGRIGVYFGGTCNDNIGIFYDHLKYFTFILVVKNRFACTYTELFLNTVHTFVELLENRFAALVKNCKIGPNIADYSSGAKTRGKLQLEIEAGFFLPPN